MRGSLGTPSAIGGTLRETTPLLIAGLAVYLALRAGLFNIGVEGQLLVGALASSLVALKIHGIAGVLIGIVAAMLAGALWSWPAGLIRAYRNGHEVITTIMLNNVALLMTTYLVAGPFKAPGTEEPSTALLGPGDSLGAIWSSGNLQVNVGLALAVFVAAAVAFWLKRTVPGYELQAVGAGPGAARFAGIDPKRTIVRAMLASGAIAGFAGAVQVFAYEHRFYEGFSPGYGFDALGVALLAGNNPLGIVPAALLFGILAKGGTALQIDGVPKGITTVVLGLLILVAAGIRFREVRAVA